MYLLYDVLKRYYTHGNRRVYDSVSTNKADIESKKAKYERGFDEELLSRYQIKPSLLMSNVY